MKSRHVLPAALLVSALLASGCATRNTASGGRQTSLLGGAVTVESNSFEPPASATANADLSKIASRGNPSGKKTTLLWGLITLHDY